MDEITAEYATEAIAEVPSLRVRTRVEVGCKTDLGRVRENNEDKFEFYIPADEGTLASKGMAFVVCDGMGGHAAGQIASELTCKTFLDVYYGHPGTDTKMAMEAAVKAGNRFVMDVSRAVPSRRGMGTTLTALILIQDKAVVAQVGDSRLYLMRDGILKQITMDHTWVDEAIARGEIPAEAAHTHPYRHVLTRAIGTEEGVEPDFFELELRQGDTFLLCSDGLINHVDDDTIQEALQKFGPSESAWRLVGKALLDGGSDNCTVMVVKVAEMAPLE
jgi:serine/threonine protein phosphatase PrpC